MRNDAGCARPGRRALALLALSALLTACSLTSIQSVHRLANDEGEQQWSI